MNDQQTTPEAAKPAAEHPLSPEDEALINELRLSLRDVENQLRGAVGLIIRQHNLPGIWRLDGNRLVQQAQG
jgi:hypothetical protein